MNKLRTLLLWCLVAGLLTSCGDKDDEPTASLDYAPSTAGSTWTYGGAATYTNTALGTTKTMNGKTFHEFETKQGTSKTAAYLSKENGVYTSMGSDPRAAGVEMTVLKEHEPVGATWTQTAVVNGVTTNYTYTIVGKGVTKTVGGKEFKEIIQVKLETVFTFMGMEVPAPVANYYHAKGIGMVMADFGPQGAVVLKSYTVK
ncbi:MAG: hypothetical protein ACO1OQ_16490 [Rufibacter sp.]